MSVWTEPSPHEHCESEQAFDSLTEYQEDPMIELSLYGSDELRKASLPKQDMLDSASERTMSRYSSVSDVTDCGSLMYDLESLAGTFQDPIYGTSADTGDFSIEGVPNGNGELVMVNSDEYQPPKISSPRNYRKFLKLVEIPDPLRKDTYRPESVMSDAMSSVTEGEEWAVENWMREVEEIREKIIAKNNGKVKKQTWSVGSGEPVSEDEVGLDMDDEKVYQKLYEIYAFAQQHPYLMSLVSDRDDESVASMKEAERNDRDDPKDFRYRRNDNIKNNGMYPGGIQKVFDIASGKFRRGFLATDPYAMNKNGLYGFPLLGAGGPPPHPPPTFYSNANTGFFQPHYVGSLRPSLLGRFGAAPLRGYNVPNGYPPIPPNLAAMRRGFPGGASLAPIPPNFAPANLPNLSPAFPPSNVPGIAGNFNVPNFRPPHSLTFRPRFTYGPNHFIGPKHGFEKRYDMQGKPPGYRPGYQTRTMLQKPATQLLMEVHKSALTYECIKEEGPVHDRSYTMKVTVNGTEFLGKAKSKKHAKWMAAAEALKTVYNIQLHDTNNNTSSPVSSSPTLPSPPQSQNGDGASVTSNSSTDDRSKMSLKPYHMDMPPVMLLNLLTTCALEYQCIRQDGPVHERLFTMKVTVQDRDFIGEGWNKRGAKAVAARKALSELFNIHQ